MIKKRIKNIDKHVIICGFGRNGKQTAIDLMNYDETVIVIENDENLIDNISEIDDLMYIHGDATHDEILQMAGIEKAKALITTLPKDADNVFVVLSARGLNSKMIIISRASEDHTDEKLRIAGADNIIMPDKIGGQQMAKLVAHPDIIDFLDNISIQSGDKVKLVEVTCENMAKCHINKTIGEFNIRQLTGTNIIGIKTENGTYIFNPSSDKKLTCQDKLFVLGNIEQIKNLRSLLYNSEIEN
ncbi:MAG: TrkA family potassium uptake protein [Bacteroidales bacterium]|nr:TrkA family potassium uptake protein [Bacteroidales bacterium]